MSLSHILICQREIFLPFICTVWQFNTFLSRDAMHSIAVVLATTRRGSREGVHAYPSLPKIILQSLLNWSKTTEKSLRRAPGNPPHTPPL